MKFVKVLLLKEFLILRKLFIPFFMVTILFPLFLYLFLSIPFSMVILNTQPAYINLSSCGIWVVSTLFLVFWYSTVIIKNKLESESLLVLPINAWHLILSNYLILIFLGIVQLILSIIITSTINHDYVNFLNIILLLILFIPIIIITSSISIILNCLIKGKIYQTVLNIFFFMVISFGYSSFIPFSFFPEDYVKYINFLPIPGLVLNTQKIISGESIMFSYFLIAIFMSIILFFVTLFLFDKKMTKNI